MRDVKHVGSYISTADRFTCKTSQNDFRDYNGNFKRSWPSAADALPFSNAATRSRVHRNLDLDGGSYWLRCKLLQNKS